MNKNMLTIVVLTLTVSIGLILWARSVQPDTDEVVSELEAGGQTVISRNGVHWHPKLEIYVNGEQQPVPANIGIGPQHRGAPTYDFSMQMTAMHTHEPDGTIHLEFPRVVTNEDVKLKNFFSIWGKDLMEFGTSVSMTVNGETTDALGEYEMKDGDIITLRYEN